MPAVPAPAKVLVTGASGFIAAWVVKSLLDVGYTVVGTVRSKAKGEYLQKAFAEYGDKFSYLIVADIEKEGAFDKAVVGVDAVEHVASPFHFKADDPQELIGPAVKGTTGILESIKKNAPGVKRVVITASVACIVYDKGKPSTFDETDWNKESVEVVEKLGKAASPIHKYRASKVLAERAAWDFVEKNKGTISFDLVTINPPMVFGPVIHEVSHPDSLNTSVQMLHQKVTAAEVPQEQLTAGAGNFVDVRDVALAHVAGLQKQEAGGNRYITSAGAFTWQDVLDSIHASGNYPDVPKGTPGSGKATQQNVFLSGKAEKELGIKFRTIEEVGPATFASLKERGF